MVQPVIVSVYEISKQVYNPVKSKSYMYLKYISIKIVSTALVNTCLYDDLCRTSKLPKNASIKMLKAYTTLASWLICLQPYLKKQKSQKAPRY